MMNEACVILCTKGYEIAASIVFMVVLVLIGYAIGKRVK